MVKSNQRQPARYSGPVPYRFITLCYLTKPMYPNTCSLLLHFRFDVSTYGNHRDSIRKHAWGIWGQVTFHKIKEERGEEKSRGERTDGRFRYLTGKTWISSVLSPLNSSSPFSSLYLMQRLLFSLTPRACLQILPFACLRRSQQGQETETSTLEGKREPKTSFSYDVRWLFLTWHIAVFSSYRTAQSVCVFYPSSASSTSSVRVDCSS